MAYTPTNWKDRDVENPRTYTARQNEDGSITFFDAPGTINEAGTPVNAVNMNKIEEQLYKNDLERKITNCITEIPQDIKWELADGVFTLKAGSKVYKGNGEYFLIERDKRTGYGNRATLFVVCEASSGNLYFAKPENVTSGTVEPEVNNERRVWLDIANKVVKMYAPNSSEYVEVGLPIAIVTTTGVDDKFASVDQVFNGFGYIGSTAFALPNVKVLIPNGRNDDGSLKNIDLTLDSVVTRTITWNNSSGQDLFIGKYTQTSGIEFISTGSLGQLYQQENEPPLVRFNMWYKPSENKVYRCDLDSNSNLYWRSVFPCHIGQWFTSATSPYPITKLTTKPSFRALGYNDKENIVSWGMPDFSSVISKNRGSESSPNITKTDCLVVFLGGSSSSSGTGAVLFVNMNGSWIKIAGASGNGLNSLIVSGNAYLPQNTEYYVETATFNYCYEIPLKGVN